MSSKFRKNTPVNLPDKKTEKYINQADSDHFTQATDQKKYTKKEFTFPLSAKHAGLLEKIYNYHDEDISRRRIGAKVLAKGLEEEAKKLGLTIGSSELTD